MHALTYTLQLYNLALHCSCLADNSQEACASLTDHGRLVLFVIQWQRYCFIVFFFMIYIIIKNIITSIRSSSKRWNQGLVRVKVRFRVRSTPGCSPLCVWCWKGHKRSQINLLEKQNFNRQEPGNDNPLYCYCTCGVRELVFGQDGIKPVILW